MASSAQCFRDNWPRLPCISPLAILYLITPPQTQLSLSDTDLLGTALSHPHSCQAQVPQPRSALTSPITKRKYVWFHHVWLSRTPASASGTSPFHCSHLAPSWISGQADLTRFHVVFFQVPVKLPALRPSSDFCRDSTWKISTSTDFGEIIV